MLVSNKFMKLIHCKWNPTKVIKSNFGRPTWDGNVGNEFKPSLPAAETSWVWSGSRVSMGESASWNRD